MSTETKWVNETTDDGMAPNVENPAARSPFIGGLVRAVLPALLAAGAAYGGSRAALAAAPAAHGDGQPRYVEARPPGPTLPLEPFLVTLFDANRRPHPMKMSVAVEFDGSVKDDIKTYVPRIRDAILAHLRMMPYEQATNPDHVEQLRAELLERCRSAGAQAAWRVLVTDFVVQ